MSRAGTVVAAMRFMLASLAGGLGMLGLFVAPVHAQSTRAAILLDTDIGTDIDDSFALALILASPELDLRGVTTVSGDTQKRAMMLCRFMTMTGRRHASIAVGGQPQPAQAIASQHQYYYHPDVLYDRTSKPVKQEAAEFLASRLKEQPGKVTVIAAGPLTNIARVLKDKPESKAWFQRIIIVGGASQAGDAETKTNFSLDPAAAQAVLASGVPLTVIPREIADTLKLSDAQVQQVFSPQTALTQQVQAMYELWNQSAPALASPLAAALAMDDRWATVQDRRVEVDDKGIARFGAGQANAAVVTKVDAPAFLAWFVERMASTVAPASKPVKPIALGNFPNRVHVAEDYDTDIERRWWMSGKEETKHLSTFLPDNRRACRGTLTHDFDDLHGNPKQMHRAVIFNPVPGPPMGKNPRLGFRYFVKGTDKLRVQIYTLTNGYHRHLIVEGLKQGEWQHAAVDMSVCRRADGTGGPLSLDERIDDIQFYTDPAVDLIIDDVVLYDAAGADEKRPFPRRILFTGIFDTGKQGAEWPGTFTIAQGEGSFWKAAKSVPRDANDKEGPQWMRIHLRGQRTLGERTQLFFRYKITGADEVRVVLTNVEKKESRGIAWKGAKAGAWAEVTHDFKDAKRDDGSAAPATKGEQVDAIDFLLPKGAELLVDDLLLYEPGE